MRPIYRAFSIGRDRQQEWPTKVAVGGREAPGIYPPTLHRYLDQGDQSSAVDRKERVIIRNEGVEIAVGSRRLAAWIGGVSIEEFEGETMVSLAAPVRLQQRGQELRFVFPGESETPPGHLALVRLLARAHRIRRRLFEDRSSIEEAAVLESVTASYVTRVVRLAFLAPDLVAAILAGRHAPQITSTRLLADSRLPLDWKLQREAFAKG